MVPRSVVSRAKVAGILVLSSADAAPEVRKEAPDALSDCADVLENVPVQA
jgi:hypothetical protein